jgi:hypothetical protein
LPRAPHGVPGQIDVRAHPAAHGSIESDGAALAIDTGAESPIGIRYGRIDVFDPRVRAFRLHADKRDFGMQQRLVTAKAPLPP